MPYRSPPPPVPSSPSEYSERSSYIEKAPWYEQIAPICATFLQTKANECSDWHAVGPFIARAIARSGYRPRTVWVAMVLIDRLACEMNTKMQTAQELFAPAFILAADEQCEGAHFSSNKWAEDIFGGYWEAGAIEEMRGRMSRLLNHDFGMNREEVGGFKRALTAMHEARAPTPPLHRKPRGLPPPSCLPPPPRTRPPSSLPPPPNTPTVSHPSYSQSPGNYSRSPPGHPPPYVPIGGPIGVHPESRLRLPDLSKYRSPPPQKLRELTPSPPLDSPVSPELATPVDYVPRGARPGAIPVYQPQPSKPASVQYPFLYQQYAGYYAGESGRR
ncbi:uncharacterized protein BXZ73DRAFT_97615 [Epithele typhae]|uniref:uncharacterized protein n=1 Tax=Epithele typhae TaxID=378194 RepID=UPI002008A9C0|nr:uncharacterized protein BXZ73DRAFT_97615 [Epithele typhae]KAH9942196.1 hypothetical protein BXZ73DRAFT_97615 [Epithele typhae]